MAGGTKDKAEGALKQSRGRVKRAIGKATDKKGIQAEGYVEEAEGKVRRGVGAVKEEGGKEERKAA